MTQKNNSKNVKIYFETYGCAINTSDSETMKGILIKDNYQITENSNDADVIIINTCTVKLPTLNRFNFMFKKYQNLKNKFLIIAGCIPQTNPELIKDVSAIGVEEIKKISYVVSETLTGKIIHLLSRTKDDRLNLPKIRKNNLVEIIPIAKGCLGNCSYCKVKLARGNLVSYPEDEIVNVAKKAIDENVTELWITAQDTGIYGADINTNIISLLKKLINLKGEFKIRLGMANPDYVYKNLKGFLEIFESDKIFRFLHIPVQSGSDKILKDMRRRYNSKEYEYTIKNLRNKFPDLTIATDIICGFPTETKTDFKKTISLMKKTMPDVINISKYSALDKTDAAKLKQLDSKIIKERSIEMTKTYDMIGEKRNLFWKNWTGKVFVDEIGKDNSVIARNYAYKPIVIKGNNNLFGKEVNVKIIKITYYDLRAEIIN